MLVVALTMLVVTSDSARALLESAAADVTPFVADNAVSLFTGVLIVAVACLAVSGFSLLGHASPQYRPPTSVTGVYAPAGAAGAIPASMLGSAAGVAKAARRVARKVRRATTAEGAAPTPRWQWFRYGNAAAWIVFAASSAYLLTMWRSTAAAAGPESPRAPAAALLASRPVLGALSGLSLSLAYLLGFASISMLHRDVLAVYNSKELALDDEDSDTEPSEGSQASAAASASSALRKRRVAAGKGNQHERASSPVSDTSSTDSSTSGTASTSAPTAHTSASGASYDADVIIVGAGVAGATLAVQLGREGRKVLLLERDMGEVDRIVGELLQPGGIRALERMGMDWCAKEGIDCIDVHGYCVIRGDDHRELPLTYPDTDPRTPAQMFGCVRRDGATNGANPTGRSFHNSRFVQNLRKEAMATPNVTVLVGIANGLLKAASADKPTDAGGDDRELVEGVTWRDDDGRKHESRAPLTVLCDGIWSPMRKHLTGAKATKASTFVGLVLEHEAGKCPLPYNNYGHVLLLEPNPVLLYQISSTETRVLVDVPGDLPSSSTGALREYLETKVSPQFPPKLRPYMLDACKRGTKSMPNRALHPEPPKLRGAALLGDSWNMRHPLTGGGMTVALKDVETFSAAVKGADLHHSEEMEARLALFRRARAGHASTVNILANALHRVFSAPLEDTSGTRKALREACYRYLSLGDVYTEGPVGLLAGLTPEPWVLTTHFFMVALYATRSAFFPVPTPWRLKAAYDLVHVACIIIMPLLDAERVSPLGFAPLLWASNVLFPWRNVDHAKVLG